jgi:predicted dehydrogenase
MLAMKKCISRRSALTRTATGLLGASALPTILPSRVFGANERIGVAMIGVRNQGSGNLKRFLRAGADVVGISDVDSTVAAEAAKLVTGPAPELRTDYRELLERSDVDAVVITTPDHWHSLMTINACQAGKDVYCEKPLSLTIAEGRRMTQAARQYARIVQTGSQQRSGEEFWKACMLVRNGWIGKIKEVHVGISGVNHPGPLGPDSQPPTELDYDRWLGPAPWRPYNEKRVHYNFRFWWDYSGGQMTNWGAHHLDIAQWALGMDASGPISVEGSASFHPENVHEVTETLRLTYTYANGVTLICGQGQKDIASGTRFIGTDGEVFVTRGKLKTTPEELASISPEQASDGGDSVLLPKSSNHTENFLECIRSRELPICDVEIGHRSATVCHLGNIVARLGRPVRWDPQSETVIGDAEAQAMTDRPYREPYDTFA